MKLHHHFIHLFPVEVDALHVVPNLEAPRLRHLVLFAATSRDLVFLRTKGDIDMHEDMPAAILMLVSRHIIILLVSVHVDILNLSDFFVSLSYSDCQNFNLFR